MELFRVRLATDIDNHPPETMPISLDFSSLGTGEYNRQGGNARWEQHLRMIQLELSVGYSEFTGSFAVKTPVLGYYDNLFPISHGVAGTFTGTVLSQDLQMKSQTNLFGFEIKPHIRYTHGYIDLEVNGEAALEFNLFSEPVHQSLQYDVHLLEGKVEVSRKIQQVQIGYEVTQMLPHVERVDSSAIRFDKPDQPADLSHRGGRLHEIIFRLTF